MTHLEVPVRAKVLWTTGDVKLWADLDLRLRDGAGGWQDMSFRVDTATDLSTKSAYTGKQLGLPMPRQAAPGIAHTQTGLEVRPGYLRFQIAGLDATEYLVPCYFRTLGAIKTVLYHRLGDLPEPEFTHKFW